MLPFLLLAALSLGLMSLAAVRLRRLTDEAEEAKQRALVETAAHREAEEMWQRIFEFAPDGYILLELDGRLDRMNRAASEISGIPKQDGEGRFIFELGILDQAGLEQAARNLAALARGDFVGPSEYSFHRPDGAERRVEVIGHLLESGGREVMLTIVHDITRRVNTEDELRRSRVRLEEAQRVAGLVTWDFDLLHGRMWVSDPAGEASGTGDGMQLGVDEAFAYVHEEDRDRLAGLMAAAVSGQGPRELSTEYRQVDALGRERIARSMSRFETDEHGNVVRMIGATLDVTEIREAEREIRALNGELEERVHQRTAELERAVAELEAFSYSVSHDLRSPLRAMAGYSEMVLDEPGNTLVPDSREHLERIRASSVRMAGMIDDLLSLSRLTRATRRVEEVDISALAAEVLDEFREADPGRRISVQVEEGLVVRGDAGMLRLVLQNLLGNAWKFTRGVPEARIELGREDGAFYVRDNGVGFDPAQSAKLFRPFERLHRVDEFEGTGIGLATVDRIVRHHGGAVWADGAIGRGSTFWFTLVDGGPREQRAAG